MWFWLSSSCAFFLSWFNVLLSSYICGQFYLLWWLVISKDNRTAQKVGVPKLVGQAFPLTTVTVVFLPTQRKCFNNLIGLKISWFHLEINYDTGIKRPARRNIGLWCSIMDKYINHTTGFFFVSNNIWLHCWPWLAWFAIQGSGNKTNTLQMFVLKCTIRSVKGQVKY